MEVTKILARYLVNSRWADIPERVRHEAARALLNFMGCAIGASRHATVNNALAAVREFAGPPQAGVLGRPERLDILHAALLNGISSAPVLPALLAYAEWRRITGAELVHAFVLGVEAEERIGLSVFPEHYEAGWHITGTAGVFGAAAAAGKLLGLDETRMACALGIAATQSAGLQEMFGSMCKSLHPGRAAQNGLAAALLAANGFTSSERAIEAPRGFARVLSTKFDPAVITEGLGSRFELMSNMYKPYACGLVVHAAIEGSIGISRENGLAPDAIEAIELTVSPLVPRLTGNADPQTGLEGKFSVYHAVAAARSARRRAEKMREPARGSRHRPHGSACYHPRSRRTDICSPHRACVGHPRAPDERRRPRGEIPGPCEGLAAGRAGRRDYQAVLAGRGAGGCRDRRASCRPARVMSDEGRGASRGGTGALGFSGDVTPGDAQSGRIEDNKITK